MENLNEKDYILPDDYVEEEAAPPEAVIEEEQQTEVEVEETKPTETQQVQTETPKVKLKYNHEEKEYSLEEVVPLAQKGMNYDKLQEKLNQLQNNPALSFVEKQAQKYGMTTEEYIDAMHKAEEQEQINELVQKNIPEEYAREMLENRKFREQQQQKEKMQTEAAKREADYREFISTFPNVKAEDVKAETWQKVENGIPLVYAYMEQERAELLNRVKILEQNAANAQKTPVTSVTAHGSMEVAEEDDFLKGLLGG